VIRAGAPARPGYGLGIAAVLLSVAIGFAVAAAPGLSRNWELVLLSTAVGSVPFAVSMVTGRFDVFEPPHLFAVSYLVLFALRPAYDVSTGLPWFNDYPIAPGFHVAMEVGIVGAAAFYAGYYSRFGRDFGRHWRVPSPNVSVASVDGFVTVSAIVTAGLYLAFVGSASASVQALFAGRSASRLSSLHNASGYLYTAPLWVTSLGVLLLALTPRWRTYRGMVAFGVIFLSELPSAAGGDRAFVLPAVAAVAILWYLRKGTRPRLYQVLLLLGVVFIVGVSAPREYRTVAVRQTSFTGVVEHDALHPVSAVQNFLGSNDTAMVDNLSVAAQALNGGSPPLSYRGGSTYIEDVTRPVPRAVWSGKPIAAETDMMSQLWPDLYALNIHFTFSMFAEPYLNFGVLGVALTLFGAGVLWRALYTWFRRAPNNPGVMTLYALSFPYLFVYMRGGFGLDYYRQAFAVIPVVLALAYAGRKRRQTGVAGTEPLNAT
jgi:oligosaccharide repeat unit polymerase